MYSLDDVTAAEARIRREAPNARVSRGDYDWKLIASLPDRSRIFIVFDHNDSGWEMWGDLDKIIDELNIEQARRSALLAAGVDVGPELASDLPIGSKSIGYYNRVTKTWSDPS